MYICISLLGFGVFAEKEFQKGDFLLQYCGEALSWTEGKERLERQEKHQRHCYVLFIQSGQTKVW
jgi:SET domain-containing protein